MPKRQWQWKKVYNIGPWKLGVPDRDGRLGTDLEFLLICDAARSGGLEDRSRCLEPGLGMTWDFEIVGIVLAFSWVETKCRVEPTWLARSLASCFLRWARVSGSTLLTEIIDVDDGVRLNFGLLGYRDNLSGRIDPALTLPASLTCWW